MLKSVKTKVILISTLTCLILIGTLSFLYLYSLDFLKYSVKEQNNITDILTKIEHISEFSSLSVIIIIAVFIIISILITLYLSQIGRAHV